MNALELKLPPLLLLALTAGLMAVVAQHSPVLPLSVTVRTLSAGAALSTGIALCTAGLLHFRRAQTTVDPRFPAESSTLVTGGPYRLSRNPMYVGFLLLLVGWGLWLATPCAWPLPVAFVLYMNRFQIGPEERALEALFGDTYRAYRARVRRWL